MSDPRKLPPSHVLKPHLLILGGTYEARKIAEACMQKSIPAIYALAGRTALPHEVGVNMRYGGFGGVDGLMRFLRDNAISHILDATHPFAQQISRHAVLACENTNTILWRFERPAWHKQAGDAWHEVEDVAAAVALMRDMNSAHVFLATGRQTLPMFDTGVRQAQMFARIFLPVAEEERQKLPSHIKLLPAQKNYIVEEEIELFQKLDIDLIVSKNAGGMASYAKIEAARHLHIQTIMIQRPIYDREAEFTMLREIIHALDTLT